MREFLFGAKFYVQNLTNATKSARPCDTFCGLSGFVKGSYLRITQMAINSEQI